MCTLFYTVAIMQSIELAVLRDIKLNSISQPHGQGDPLVFRTKTDHFQEIIFAAVILFDSADGQLVKIKITEKILFSDWI